MKFLSLAIVAIIFMAGCSKHAAVNDTGSFNGTWELTKVSGDITITYPAGNGNLLKFSGSNYQTYAGGSLKIAEHLPLLTIQQLQPQCVLFFHPASLIQG